MIKALKTEFLKTKRRYILLTVLAITAIEIIWFTYGDLSDDVIAQGWLMLLYQTPIVNAIIHPFLCCTVASRLCDIEYKGLMFKQLSCIYDRGALFDAKLLFGMMFITLSILIQFAAMIVYGAVCGFGGTFPLSYYGMQILFTIAITGAVYLVQHILSITIKNQTIPFVIGVLGTFAGLFSMFLPQLPWLRKIILWGYYGEMMFIGNNWSRETRINDFYMMGVSWSGFITLIIFIVVIYIIGKKLFISKEV